MSVAGAPASRFAPSPTGFLHKGHALSAVIAAKVADQLGGRFILRVEDIDAERSRPEFETAIYEDLAWLGLGWETPVRRQSDHLDDYANALDRLRERGLVYRCFKTRAEVLADIGRAPHGPTPAFVGAPLAPTDEARRLDAGEAFAWRLSMSAARETLGSAWNDLDFVELGHGPTGETGPQRARPELSGDVILGRKGLGVAYHLAVVVDDARQSVTHVVRGEDLFEAVPVQRLLQVLLGLPAPSYHHHRLVLDPDGKRLAKRDRAETLRALRGSGVTPEALKASLNLT